MERWQIEQAEADIAAANPGPLATDERLTTLYRYMRARAALEAEIDQVKAGTAYMLGELQNRLTNLETVFGGPVAAIVQTMITDKKRSVKTPWGIAGFRKHPARLVVVDEQAIIKAVEYGRLPPAAIQTVSTVKVVKAVLDNLYERDGEVPPGCEEKEAEDVFYTKGSDA